MDAGNDVFFVFQLRFFGGNKAENDLLFADVAQRFKAAVMTKDDKIDFIRLLNDAGAFLITKSGQRVCQVLCISKFTLYSYLNEIKAEDEETKAEQD